MNTFSIGTPSTLWDVFLLFAVPVGGGIPAGVVLAQNQGLGWLPMTLLYFISDVALALVFEPFMIIFGRLCNHVPWLSRMREAMKTVTNRTIAGYGASPGPILLIAISFGIDPMTGRAAALASGHSFISGWAIAIAGDMIFFGVIAVSTICLNNVIGDGTTASLIVMIAMFIVPPLIRRIYKSIAPESTPSSETKL